jgi:uncharacterized NAD(P)/FAD-binding protein YdhS
MKRITIIGGGLSGTLVAINLLRINSKPGLDIKLVDKKSVGAGLAYSTEQSIHLLNVRAGNMSLFPEEPGHFSGWLREKKLNFSEKDFVPRNFYGKYVTETFEKIIFEKKDQDNFEIINDEAEDIIPNNSSCLIKLKTGNEIESDKVVLAFGNFYSADLNLKDNSYLKSKRYHTNPWDNKLYESLNKDETILIIGTGLTMIDIVLNLHQVKHREKIIAVSKHGLIPFSHKHVEAYPSFYEKLSNKNLPEILNIIRSQINNETIKGNDWRGVIDSLKPYIQNIWINLSLNDKKRFLEHLKHFWNPVRHRVPSECFDIINQLLITKQLKIIAARINKITEINNSYKIELKTRHQNIEHNISEKNITADVIIKCSGTEGNYERINIPLIKNLLSRGLVRKDPLSLGLDAQINGRIIDKEGIDSKYLFTLGQPLLGILWETTAVPEIRTQAQQLANLLTKTINN